MLPGKLVDLLHRDLVDVLHRELSSCCVPGPACTTDQLTIGSSPDPSTEGKPVTISGKLTPASAGQTVSLWQKLPGQASFSQVGQATTNAAGDYSIVRGAGTVLENSTWYVSVPDASSTTIVQHVSALVALSATPRKPHTNKSVTFSGHVSPSHAGERMLLQQRTANGWKTIARGTLGTKSRFTVHHKFTHKGVVVLRVVLAADSRNTQSYSPAVKVSVG